MVHAATGMGRAEGHVSQGQLGGRAAKSAGKPWLEPCQHLPPLEIALTENGLQARSPLPLCCYAAHDT